MYFKVTSNLNRSLYGFCFPSYALDYTVYKWTKPKVGKIFCYHISEFIPSILGFPEYNANMIESMKMRRLWRCDVRNPTENGIVTMILDVERYWNNVKVAYNTEGTFADEIRLTTQVTLSELEQLHRDWCKTCISK